MSLTVHKATLSSYCKESPSVAVFPHIVRGSGMIFPIYVVDKVEHTLDPVVNMIQWSTTSPESIRDEMHH